MYSGNEYGDPLTIYDGPNDQSTQIEKLSGFLGSFGISSTGNSLFVKFQSDDYSMGETGFLAAIHHGNPYSNSSSIMTHLLTRRVGLHVVGHNCLLE